MAEVKYFKGVPGPFPAFEDRSDAGVKLAEFVNSTPDGPAIVLALPRGGIPVGKPLAELLGADLEPVLVRKLPIPDSPEAGFGAVAIDGSRALNEKLLSLRPIPQREIDRITDEVLREVRRRAREYVGTDRPPHVAGKRVFLVDDGLASGYTCIAAATMIRKMDPASMTLAVPVSPQRSIVAVEDFFDEINCLLIQAGGSFAVASFYNDFHEMTDREVVSVLESVRK